MLVNKYFWSGVIATMGCSSIASAGDLISAIENSAVNGNFRAYYNTRDYETRTDTAAFAIGGALRAETGAFGAVKVGLGYYTAQDVGVNSSDPAEVNGTLGSSIEVLGEAYIKANMADTMLTLGRQKLSTPFANGGDAFMIPFTFEGVSIKNTSISDLTIELDHVNTIKNRNSDEFIDVGQWSTKRYGVTETGTSGTTILGATYAPDGMKIQGWIYNHADLFSTVYLQGNYSFSTDGDVKPFVAAQFVSQSETGDELLGKVDSTVWGIQGGASMGKAKLTLAYNTVADEAGSFKNGAFLAPYNFSTSPLFTNNMLATVENTDAGDAVKVTLNYSLAKAKVKVSYAEFDFDSADDREAVDVDVIYSLEDITKGLTVRWRVESLTSDNDAVEQLNNRLQFQLKF